MTKTVGLVPRVCTKLYDRLVLQKAMSDFFWGLWSIVQHATGNPAADYWSYATGRFERCKTLMSSTEFGSAVSACYKPKQ